MCEIPQHGGGGFFLLVVPIAHQRHERRDATGLCDGNSVVEVLLVVVIIHIRIAIFVFEIPQRAGGGCFLRVVPIAQKRHERRDATGLCDGQYHIVVGSPCENPQRIGGGYFLVVVPIAHQRHERRDAAGPSDGLRVVGYPCEIPQRAGGGYFLVVRPIAHQRHERRDRHRSVNPHSQCTRGQCTRDPREVAMSMRDCGRAGSSILVCGHEDHRCVAQTSYP